MQLEWRRTQASGAAIAGRGGGVEAGAQGDHQTARGYPPTPTHSSHSVGHEGLPGAVAHFTQSEQRAVEQELALLMEESPYRQGDGAG